MEDVVSTELSRPERSLLFSVSSTRRRRRRKIYSKLTEDEDERRRKVYSKLTQEEEEGYGECRSHKVHQIDRSACGCLGHRVQPLVVARTCTLVNARAARDSAIRAHQHLAAVHVIRAFVKAETAAVGE